MEQPEEFLIQQLMEEIMSLEREREHLLDSLTPSLSGWKATTQRTAGAEEEKKSSETEPARGDDEKELLISRYMDSILEDMEGLGYRMLSAMASIPSSSRSLFKAKELASTTSRLMHASQEFCKDSCNEEDEEEHRNEDDNEELSNEFLSICSNYLQSPEDHKNQLALLVFFKHKLALMIATEEKEKECNEKEGEEEKKHRKEKEEDPSTMEFLKMAMKFYHKRFTSHHACWERVWGSECMMGRCGAFEDTTTLSSMHLTHCTPSAIPSYVALSGSTLQIYSIQIKDLNGNLSWPLKVYGVVAARDTVDRNRNILFSRTKRSHQLLTEKDPFLRLTGPSRAILAVDPVDFEVELKINEGSEFREIVSISLHNRYYATDNTSLFLCNPNCTVELSIDRLATPLQATIVGARVVEGRWPFKHGCRVVCSTFVAAAESTTREIVLLDYHGKGMRVGWDGYLHLSRNVVSVELQGTLRVVIQAYSESGHHAQEGNVDFPAQQCQTRKGECFLGNTKLEIVVAWSLLVKEKLDLLVDCPAIERSVAPP